MGRQALLTCIELNKLECLALGGCTGFGEGGGGSNGGGGGDGSKKWWDKFCNTIRESGFRLHELTVEGIEGGE